jgi:hypothetical protein
MIVLPPRSSLLRTCVFAATSSPWQADAGTRTPDAITTKYSHSGREGAWLSQIVSRNRLRVDSTFGGHLCEGLVLPSNAEVPDRLLIERYTEPGRFG